MAIPSSSSNTDDAEMYQLASAELQRLQRQYRIMERDREAYQDEMRISIAKQRRIIDMLSREKQELLLAARVNKSEKQETKNASYKNRIEILLKQQDLIETKIKSEQLQLKELDAQIRKVEDQVNELRSSHMNDDKYLIKVQEQNREVDLLENRLHTATVKFNKMLMGNRKLKHEIDLLVKSKAHFNDLYQQLIQKLADGKKVILDLIEQATVAYDQREESQNKLFALKERDKVNVAMYGHEMRELQRELDHDFKLQEFLGIKGQKRIMQDLELREAEKKKEQRESLSRTIEKFENILQQIKEVAALFIKQEEENFALFNYVNELNNECEMLKDQVKELTVNINEQRAINKQKAMEQQDTLDSLTQELRNRQNDTNTMKSTLDNTTTITGEILDKINTLFVFMKQNQTQQTASVLNLLGDSTSIHVNKYNVSLFLAIIEKTINQLLNIVNAPVEDTSARHEDTVHFEFPPRR
ncbi:hypothetical protein M8J76_009182 [Diaphorina citri]|nr:hypothetical protein M8J76_009182 [Diaphorina citri]